MYCNSWPPTILFQEWERVVVHTERGVDVEASQCSAPPSGHARTGMNDQTCPHWDDSNPCIVVM